jgi:hypothetical protein
VVGATGDPDALKRRTEAVSAHIEKVSRAKSDLAYNSMCALMNRLEGRVPDPDQVCFIIAGDIVYSMAHDVPRPERSTGKLVKGSDIDIVVIVCD